MKKIMLLILSIMIMNTCLIVAEDGAYAGFDISLKDDDIWYNDTVSINIKSKNIADIYAVSIEFSYGKQTLKFKEATHEFEGLFSVTPYIADDTVVLGYTLTKDAKGLESFKADIKLSAIEEGEAGVLLKKITVIDSQLNQTEYKINQNINFAVKRIHPAPTHSGGGGGGGGGSISLPVASKTPMPTIAPTPKVEPTPMPETINFTDLEQTAWAKEAIMHLAQKNIISNSDKFNPNNNITRAEFVKLVVLALEIKPSTATFAFEDVPTDSWYKEYIDIAASAGILTGYNNKINPNDYISRQDCAVILSRAANLSTSEKQNELTFSDKIEIADYAMDGVQLLYSLNIITGMEDGSFRPKDFLTRAEGVKMIYEILRGKNI